MSADRNNRAGTVESLIDYLRSLSVDELFELVRASTVAELRALWDAAGIEEPEDDEDPEEPVTPRRDWYFPLEVLEAICDRLPEYGWPIRIDAPTVATSREAKVPALARRRGEGAEYDDEVTRANPRRCFSLWSPGDHRRGQLPEHARQSVTRKRNGSSIVGKISVEESELWTVAGELAAWRERNARCQNTNR